MEYKFTREQLVKLLSGCIDMYVEFLEKHGHVEESAHASAIVEMMRGVDAELELISYGETLTPSFTPVYPVSPDDMTQWIGMPGFAREWS